MRSLITRRNILRLAGAGALVGPASMYAQQQPAPGAAPGAGAPGAAAPGRAPGAAQPDPFMVPVKPLNPFAKRSTVSLVKGENRRKMVHDALMAIDNELKPALKRKKYVLIKVNLTSVTNQLASTHPDALRGMLDYLGPRFKGPIIIGEAASNDTLVGFDNFKYHELESEFKSQKVSLLDFNLDGKYALVPTIDSNVHMTPCRIAARLVDPDAFVLDACIAKTHDAMIFTGAVKNMAMGSALRSPGKVTPAWSDKRRIHVTGYQQHHMNLYLVSQRLSPTWGAVVLDNYEGMEGNGPVGGTMVPHRIAMASTDYIAADRVAVEALGMNANWIGYLQYCAAVGMGNYDLEKIDVRGETVESVKRTYQLHRTFEIQRKWDGPLTPLTPPGQGAQGGGRAG